MIVSERAISRALAELGCRRALVVCGNDEIDEVSLWGTTTVNVVSGGGVTQETWSAATFGLPECSASDLRVGSPEESAAVIRGVFGGEPGPARHMVLVNTAAALIAAERADDPRSAVATAAEAIDSGKAAAICERLAEWTSA